MKRISKMKFAKSSIAFVFIASIALFLSSYQSEKGDEGLKIGNKMPFPTESMKGSDGESYTLADLKGENGLIVVFSCNTCPFVVGSESFPGWEVQYNDLYAKAQENNLGMVLVNSNAANRDGVDSQEKMRLHAEELGYSMPYVIDEDAKLADAVGAKTTPHVYVFNGANKLIYKGSIDNSWDTKKEKLETYLIDVMDAISAGESIPNESTTPRGCSIKRNK